MTAAAPTAVRTVPPAEVHRRREAGDAVDLIDVRTEPEYAQVHAVGARLVSLNQLDPQVIMADRNGSADQPLYMICKSGSRSAKAVEKFHAAGFHNVLSVEGGTEAWQKASLPVERGESNVISLERQVRIGAGLMVLVGILLGWLVHPGFYGLSAFVGAGLVFAGITDWCGMGLMLARMPWNR